MSLYFIGELDKLFISQNWKNIPDHESVFERFGKLIDSLDENENKLIIELMSRYLWTSPNDVYRELRSLMLIIIENLDPNINKLFFFPIVKKVDEDKPKSGITVLYNLTAIIPRLPECAKYKIRYLAKYDDLAKSCKYFDQNSLLILVDDFIGTGDTLDDTLRNIYLNKEITSDKINILTIAIQQPTKENLENINLVSYHKHILKKGISDFYVAPILDDKVNLMHKIEKLIKISPTFRFGFMQSEALITLLKTPDNTFPIFWKERGPKSKPDPAPFQRNLYE